MNRIKAHLGSVPRWIWLTIGGAALGIALLTTLLIFVLIPNWAEPFTRLDANASSLYHPDGLTLTLIEGDLRARLKSVPRDLFISGQAGKTWDHAREKLPDTLTPISPLYIIELQGMGHASAEMTIPNGADPLALLDLYRWDRQTQQWVFVPSRQDLARGVIVFQPEASLTAVLAVHTEPQSPSVGIVFSPGASNPSFDSELAIPEGVAIDGQGQIVGTPVSVTAPSVLPLVRNGQGGFTAYADVGLQNIYIDQLMVLLTLYDGLVLDFDPAPGYADFVAALAKRVHSHGKRLELILRGPSLDADELAELVLHADRFWYAPGDNPIDYLPNGPVGERLGELVGTVERGRLGLLVSGLTVEVVNGVATPIPPDQALAMFGTVEPYFDPESPLLPESDLPLRLTGRVTSMGFDVPLGMNYLTVYDQDGQLHHIYFGSGQNLSRKLAWARYYGLGSVMIYGLAHPDAPEHLADGLKAFLSTQPIGDPPPLSIVWRVESASGAKLAETEGDLTLIQYLWKAASEPGQYAISAAIRSQDREVERGRVVIAVGDQGQTVQADEPTPAATPGPQAPPTEGTPTPTPQPTAAPVGQTIVAGMFELGGQTHTLAHPNEMKYAGMTWVKFQHKWGKGDDPAGTVGGRIQQAHALGFKVLLSIPGGEYPEEIDFEAYVNYLAGVAALGPDAIEIWNEMNLDREWPYGQIDGANYVKSMLAPAYQAIKAVNPNIMVISGAPSPTGAWGGCVRQGCDDWFYIAQMRDAGATSYLDCVGIHYNEGIIPPSQTTGDPRAFGDHYTRYFFGMLNLYYGTFGKPLCFTELGYLSPEGYGTLPPAFAWAQDTTVAEQAAWLREAAILSSQSGKVRLMIIFNVDFTSFGSDPQAGYAMIRPGGGCPACEALHAALP